MLRKTIQRVGRFWGKKGDDIALELTPSGMPNHPICGPDPIVMGTWKAVGADITINPNALKCHNKSPLHQASLARKRWIPAHPTCRTNKGCMMRPNSRSKIQATSSKPLPCQPTKYSFVLWLLVIPTILSSKISAISSLSRSKVRSFQLAIHSSSSTMPSWNSYKSMILKVWWDV